MALEYPSISPVLLEFGIFKVSWYSLSYIFGVVLGYYYVLWLNDRRQNKISRKIIEDGITYIVLGVVIGGRLGYVLFYKPYQYLMHPLEIFMIWKGGMSFHGAVLGVIFAIYLFSRFKKIGFLYFNDCVAAAAPIGFGLGRIANFINDELYGRVTDVPWAVLFPRGGYLPRHPSQLYESALEGVVLFAILFFASTRCKYRDVPGFIASLFLIFYSSFRCFIELYREPDVHLGFLFGHISMGQLLSVPMFILGLIVFAYSMTTRKHYV